jgi:hypothetical protein
MGHLGDFGVEHEQVTGTFGYFGETLRVNPDLTDLLAFEAFRQVQNADNNASALDAVRGVLEVMVHPDDVETCWQLAKANRQGFDEVADLATSLLGALADRPTKPLSDSSPSPSSDDQRSEGGSSSPALRLLDGRPDLQVMVQRAAAS